MLGTREEIVGIEHEGLIVRIARVKLRAGEADGATFDPARAHFENCGNRMRRRETGLLR